VINKQIVKEVLFIAKNTAEITLQRDRQSDTMGKLECRRGVSETINQHVLSRM
jgi:spore coat protein CotH